MQSGEREEDCVARISDQRCSAAINWGIADGQAARATCSEVKMPSSICVGGICVGVVGATV